MHPSLTDGPFVPHNLISTQKSPVPLLEFQMAPRLKILTFSGSKKGTQIYLFLSKVPANEPPPGSPTGTLWREMPVYRAYLSKTSSFGFPVKEPSPKVPCTESLAERCLTTTALLHSSTEVPGIRAPHPHIPGSPQVERAPMERDAHIRRLFLTYLPGSPV